MVAVTEMDVQPALCTVSTESRRADLKVCPREGVCGAVVGPADLTPPGSGAEPWVPHFGEATSKWHVRTEWPGRGRTWGQEGHKEEGRGSRLPRPQCPCGWGQTVGANLP